MKIAILGTGAFGIALSTILKENKHQITMWSRFSTEIEELSKKRTCSSLKNHTIPVDIFFTSNMKEAVLNKDIIIIAIPTAFLDDVSKELSLYIQEKQHLCIASKGTEKNTGLFASDIIKKYICTNQIAVLSGPSFAEDIIKQTPIGFSLGSKNKETILLIQKAFTNNYIKLHTTDDIIGIELCGSIKNVIAIASGILEGLNLPSSTKAMFLTEALHVMKEFIIQFGGKEETIFSYAGIGDFILTCTSSKSRNFTFGYLIGTKENPEKIEQYKKETTLEGYDTLKSMYQFIQQHRLHIPLIIILYQIIEKRQSPESLISCNRKDLFL